MEQLWAPWRLEYIGAPKPAGCVFCLAHQSVGQERQTLVLYRDPRAVVLLNRFPYNNGHLLVCPAQHQGNLLSLAPDDFNHLGELVRSAYAVLLSAYQPQGCNIGMNLGACAGAGIVDHVHWHLVPRWGGDTNFMPVLADVRSMAEHLDSAWERLRPHFAELEQRWANEGRLAP